MNTNTLDMITSMRLAQTPEQIARFEKMTNPDWSMLEVYLKTHPKDFGLLSLCYLLVEKKLTDPSLATKALIKLGAPFKEATAKNKNNSYFARAAVEAIKHFPSGFKLRDFSTIPLSLNNSYIKQKDLVAFGINSVYADVFDKNPKYLQRNFYIFSEAQLASIAEASSLKIKNIIETELKNIKVRNLSHKIRVIYETIPSPNQNQISDIKNEIKNLDDIERKYFLTILKNYISSSGRLTPFVLLGESLTLNEMKSLKPSSNYRLIASEPPKMLAQALSFMRKKSQDEFLCVVATSVFFSGVEIIQGRLAPCLEEVIKKGYALPDPKIVGSVSEINSLLETLLDVMDFDKKPKISQTVQSLSEKNLLPVSWKAVMNTVWLARGETMPWPDAPIAPIIDITEKECVMSKEEQNFLQRIKTVVDKSVINNALSDLPKSIKNPPRKNL